MVSLPYSQELPCLCLEVSEGVASATGGDKGPDSPGLTLAPPTELVCDPRCSADPDLPF